jgi:hypothetical protein
MTHESKRKSVIIASIFTVIFILSFIYAYFENSIDAAFLGG